MKDDLRKNHIINSKKHTIEFVDTDGIENLKFAHFNGGFKEFTNFANIEFAPEQDQKLVIGDQFNSVNSDRYDFVGMDKTTNTAGSEYENVGVSDKEVSEQIKNIITDIHQYMQLFDVRRARLYDGSDVVSAGGVNKPAESLPNFVSPLQKKEKTKDPINPSKVDERGHFVCPKCENATNPTKSNFNTPVYLTGLTKPNLITNPANLVKGDFPYLSLIGVADQSSISIPYLNPLDIKLGLNLAKFNGQPGFHRGSKCDICNSDLLFVPDKKPGWSPSSFGGEFEPEDKKLPGGEMENLIINYTPVLVELEKNLSGGDKIINISRNKIEKIGTVMNDLPSIRVDPIGKMRTESICVAPQEVYVSFRPSPHIESVDVLNMPGGDYILTAGNKYKLLVGAKGINIKTFGPLDMYGTLVNFTGQQINISSQYETNIDGGDRINLRARKISFTPKEHSPVIVDGALHVSRNFIARGGAYIDGQFAAPAIASVREIAQTSGAIYRSGLLSRTEYVARGKGFGETGEVDVAVAIPTHYHLYDRPASQLFNSIEALRAFMSDPLSAAVNGGGDGSINDVKSVVAASSVNSAGATEDGMLAVSQYAELLRPIIIRFLKITSTGFDTVYGTIGPLNPNAPPAVNGTTLRGSFQLEIGEPTRFRSANNRERYAGPGTYRINYDISFNPETEGFVKENSPPRFNRLDIGIPEISNLSINN